MWQIKKLGKISYQEAYELQLSLVEEKILKQLGCSPVTVFQGSKAPLSASARNPQVQNDNVCEKFFLLCEHEPVFTRGKGSKEANILDKNISVIMTNRGGDLTYHEQGQLVGYIILDLKAEKLTVKAYLNKIENLIINTLSKLGIEAGKHHDLVGVWVGEKKIASIGIGIKKGVAMHGFALNINNSMDGFSRINPCGLDSNIMTSIKALKGEKISFDLVQDLIIKEFNRIF